MHTHSKLCDKWIVSTWFQSVSYLSYIPLIIQSYTFLFSLPMHVLISVDTAATKTDDWVRDCLACSCCMVWSMERRHRCIEKRKRGEGALSQCDGGKGGGPLLIPVNKENTECIWLDSTKYENLYMIVIKLCLNQRDFMS